MLPNPTSDDDSSTADEEPSITPSNPPNLTAPTATNTTTTTTTNNNNNNNNNNINNNNNNNNTNTNTTTPQHFHPHPSSSLTLYHLPASSSSSAPNTSSSSFPSSIPSHPQPPAFTPSSPHPNNPNNHQQHFYHPSPPPFHSPLHPTPPQHSFNQHHPHSNLFLPHQTYHSRPQSAPHSTTQLPLDPQVLAAAANIEVKKWDEENTLYYQVIHKGIAVGRVKGSGLVNGTKLLNLSGISRGKRDGILKNEKIRKVVKHGTMHLKGVWIAYDRACTLAEQYNIADKIFPLLVLNLEQYVPIEQQVAAGASKLASHSLFQHHRGQPRLLPQPIKFPTAGINLAPIGTSSISSSGAWSAGPSSGRGIEFGEPYSAPPVGRNDTGVSSVYEQAQYDYLNANNSSNSDLLERRHTIPNHYNGYHPMASFASPQPHMSYPFQYTPSHLGGYPPRSSASDSTSSCQFEYQQKSQLDALTTRNGTGTYPSLFHSQPSSTRPPSTAGTHNSPALHSAPLLLGDVSPLPPSHQILDHPHNDFRLANGPSGRHLKEKIDDDSGGGGGGVAEDHRFRSVKDCGHENNKNGKTNFQDSIGPSGSLSSSLPTWNVNQGTGMMNATMNESQRLHRNAHHDRLLAEDASVPVATKSTDGGVGRTSTSVPSSDTPPTTNTSELDPSGLTRGSSDGDYTHPSSSQPHPQNPQDPCFHPLSNGGSHHRHLPPLATTSTHSPHPNWSST